MKRIYLMRHGETLFNTQHRVQGWCDSPLTALGIEQAQMAAKWFNRREIAFDALYASTQEQARDTAAIVGQREDVTLLKGLKEMNFGQFEAQPEMLLPKFRAGAKSFEDLLVPYGGEDILSVGKRVFEALQEILNNDGHTILAVSHGAAMWGLMQYLEISLPDGIWFGNCAITNFVVEGDRFQLQSIIDPISDKEVVI